MNPLTFTIEKKLQNKLGRVGTIKTPHGVIHTPAFVTVGTKGTVKALTPEMVASLGAEVVLANTYHLYLQPGDDIVKQAGGLQKFMNWNGPTMTDSGGFQVFSLGAAYGKELSKITKARTGKEEVILSEITETSKNKNGRIHDEDDLSKGKLAKIDHDGVMFRSHIDGSAHYFTPEKSIEIQHNIGADIIFAFDECTSPNEPFAYQREALDRTHRWAKKSLTYHISKDNAERQALFGVIQGGREEKLRKESAEILSLMEVDGKSFDGFGIGGSFAKEDMSSAVSWVNSVLPESKPRHLLGIGEPEDLFMAIEQGCDLFDCVAPTRIARNGQLYTLKGKININNAQFIKDFSPVESECECYTCKHYTRAYLSHLFRADEMLAATLASAHNLYFIINLVKKIRQSILDDSFEVFKNTFLNTYK